MHFPYKLIRAAVILSCALLLLQLSACRKFVDVPPPETAIQTSQVFENDVSAISAMTGLYNRMINATLSISNGGPTLYPSLSADDLYTTASTNTADVFYKNSTLPNTSQLNSLLWIAAYRNIYHANALLEGLANSATLSDSVKKQLHGEALLIRAFQFFHLVNLFGDVPMTLTTNYETNSVMPRTPAMILRQQIMIDLLQAKSLLSSSYPAGGKARANKLAAVSLLSRMYLYQKNWPAAEAEASEVIGSGIYQLVSDLNNVFLIPSTETIWQLANDNNNTADGITFIPASATTRPNYAITPTLLAAFENNDARKTKWLKFNTISATPFYYPTKYKVRVMTPITEHYVVLRLAELYLIRAEARAEQNNLAGALADLNIIRNRAGLSNSTATDKSALLAAIAKERQTELFCEWGHRWFDLKRKGMTDAVLAPLKAPNWQATDTLYPIPLAQLLVNPALTQNPGY